MKIEGKLTEMRDALEAALLTLRSLEADGENIATDCRKVIRMVEGAMQRHKEEQCPNPTSETSGASADTRSEITHATPSPTASPASSEIPSGRTAQATDPLPEAIRAYMEARKGSLDPDDLSAVGFPDTAESIRHADRLADEAEKAEAELTEARKKIATLTGDEAWYRGEAEELRKSIKRLQAYCQRHELSGLGTHADECVTAECDRLRAALKVERKSVDEMRNNILYVYESNGVKKASTRVLDRDVYAWCRAVDERRNGETK